MMRPPLGTFCSKYVSNKVAFVFIKTTLLSKHFNYEKLYRANGAKYFFTGKYLSKRYFIYGAAEKITFNKNANCWVNNKMIKCYYL